MQLPNTPKVGTLIVLLLCLKTEITNSFNLNHRKASKVTTPISHHVISPSMREIRTPLYMKNIPNSSFANKIIKNRRSVISQILSTTAAATTLLLPLASAPVPANAKTKEPITAETISSAFSAVRYELDDPSGGITLLERIVSEENWDQVKEFTKYYDLEFRKAKMGRAKKLMPDKDMKEEATALCNAVTFDLIGINKAARVGDVENAKKYLKELKDDISRFLAFEGDIKLV